MKCKFCQGAGELVVVEEIETDDGSIDEVIDVRPCVNCHGTGEMADGQLGGPAPRVAPPPLPPATRHTFETRTDLRSDRSQRDS